MVIEKILKQLTPERIEKEIKKIQEIKLPLELQKWVKEYEKVGERDEFFWKFIYRINQIAWLPDMPNLYEKPAMKVKFLMVMFIILLDDLADKTKNKQLLEQVLKIPFGQNYITAKPDGLDRIEKEYLRLAMRLWRHIKKIIRKYPRYKEFKNIFEYDIRQALNAMNYAYLVNKNSYLINKTEYWLYSPHTLQGMINCTLDLMCISKFSIKELGKVREIFWEAQKMIRIGNCLSTWKKELSDGDLTSGICAYAVSLNLMDARNLNSLSKTDIIRKINRSCIQEELLKEKQQSYHRIRRFCKEIQSVDLMNLPLQLEKLFLVYLATEDFNK